MATDAITITVHPHFSYTLRKLRKFQEVYPFCEIINQFIDLFEVLYFYESSLDKEIQSVIADSGLSILKELISIAKTLEPYLDSIPDEKRGKIEEILNFDADDALTILDD